MAFNLTDLLLSILACACLVPIEAYNKYHHEKFYKYYDEVPVPKPSEQKRYKWMAEDVMTTSTQSSTVGSSDTTTSALPMTSSQPDVSDFVKNQDKLLNAVALIRQVLSSAQTSGGNKTELLKLARQVAGKRERLDSKHGLSNDAITSDDDYEDEKEAGDEDYMDKQEKLKRDFWETSRSKYRKSLSSFGKDDSEKLSSDEMDSFELGDKSLEEEIKNDIAIIKREENTPKVDTAKQPSADLSTPLMLSPTTTVLTNVVQQPSNLTGKEKNFIRRHLWFKQKPKMKYLRKSKRINIRKKRIGELSQTNNNMRENKDEENTNEESFEVKKRDCGGSFEFARRGINGCGKFPIT